ncbi:MAG: MarR family transcriptional regulator [Clostridia bacterium]|nr:MarR family transcriptional regulator [Clostridia bacterium]MBO4429246.1 MarR family transcriptional regulator [Clostridia bacterium]
MDDIISAMHKIIYIAKSHHAVVESNMKDVCMHRSMQRLLMYLSDCKESPTQKEIAEKFEISAAAVAATLDRLESENYVEKIISGTDRRANRVRITQKGADAVEKTRDIFAKIDGETFKGLAPDDIKALCAYLDVICANLSEMKKDQSKGGEDA